MFFEKKCALEDILNSPDAPKDTPSAIWIDGYMTAVIVGPSMVLPSQWLPVIFEKMGAFENEDMANKIVGALMGHYTGIVQRLDDDTYLPIHIPTQGALPTKEAASEWGKGFWTAMSMDDTWDDMFDDEDDKVLLFPILSGIMEEDGTVILEGSEEKLQEIFEISMQNLPAAVTAIQEYWRKYKECCAEDFQEDFSQEIRVNKTGRNAPCPCGSEKKYKRCCGAN